MNQSSALPSTQVLAASLYDTLRPCRIEAWEEDGRHNVLVVADNGFVAEIWRLCADPRTGEILAGVECPDNALSGRHGNLATLPRTALADAVEMKPLEMLEHDMWGLPFGPKSLLARHMAGIVLGNNAKDSPIWRFPKFYEDLLETEAKEPHRPTGLLDKEAGPLRWGYNYHFSRQALPRPFRREALQRIDESMSAGPSRRDPERSGHVAMPRPVLDAARDTDANVKAYTEQLTQAIKARLDEALGPVRAMFDPDVARRLGRRQWTPEAQAFYGAPGRVGERRRQALRLYPAFAPLLARDAELAGLIDAGRPFETRLRDVVAGLLRADLAPGLTVAAVRRFRTLSGDMSFDGIAGGLVIAAQVPPDWLPRDEEGWQAMLRHATFYAHYFGDKGLDLADILRPAAKDWVGFQRLNGMRAYGPQGENTLLPTITDSKDMGIRLTESLIVPLFRSILGEGARAFDGFNPRSFQALATGMLFRGKSLFGISKLSSEWHAEIDRFERDLPKSTQSSSWPRLFESPFRSRDIEIVCLGDVAELREEGSGGLDRHGAQGLGHCVGGYGKQCWTGASHILSVRQRLPEGGYKRLSTVEIAFAAGGMVVSQHRGAFNKEPSPRAEEALKDLREAVQAGTVEVNPEALKRRSDAEYSLEYDWRDEANLEQAFAAWTPYLHGDVVAAGLDGLREEVREVVTEMARSLPPHVAAQLSLDADRPGPRA